MGSGGSSVTEVPGKEENRPVMDVCPGCGGRLSATGAVNVLCDEKGYPVELLRLCADCADLFATGTAEERMGLFDRVGEIESAFFVCPVVQKRMASN